MLPILPTPSMPSSRNGRPVHRLDALFDRVFREDGTFEPAWTAAPVAMWEDEDHVCVEVEVPGMAEGDLDVTVHNNMLFVRGERKPVEGRRYLYNGRTFGRFERVIRLPEAVHTEGIEATLKDGIIAVRLPRSPEATPRKITLRTS